jgi:beta propeller repeat protein
MQTLAKKYNPAIYNDIVVWEDRGITNCTITGITLSERELFQVPGTPDAQKWPAIYGDIVVWQDGRDLGKFIYGYNLSTGEEFQIGTDHMVLPTYRKSAPAIHENTIIWTATSNYIIYAYDLVTSQESVIATASMKKCYLQIPHRSACDDLQRPAIFKNIIVWVDCRNENEDIYGYNLSTDQEFQVITDEYSQCSPALYEDFVVWQDNRNGNWDIYGMYVTPPLVITSFKSRTWVILYFFESIVIWALLAAVAVAPSVFLVYLVYLYWYWHVKKVRYTEASSSVRPKDFKRNAVSTTPIVALAVITVFTGCFYVISSDFSSGLIFSVVLAFSCVIYYFWSRRTPYIRLTTDEIMIFRSMGRKPTVVNLGSIKSVSVQTWVDIPYRIDVSVSDNTQQPEEHTRVHIGILSLKERDKAELIQVVTQVAD